MVAENQVIGPLGLKRWSVINTHSRMGGSILLNCASVGVGGWEFLPFVSWIEKNQLEATKQHGIYYVTQSICIKEEGKHSNTTMM